jgi:hypothetical protein
VRARASRSIGAVGHHPGGHVGDGVAHPPPAVGADLDGQGLVEVARTGRVDRDQLEVGGVALGPGPAGGLVGRGQHVGSGTSPGISSSAADGIEVQIGAGGAETMEDHGRGSTAWSTGVSGPV